MRKWIPFLFVFGLYSVALIGTANARGSVDNFERWGQLHESYVKVLTHMETLDEYPSKLEVDSMSSVDLKIINWLLIDTAHASGEMCFFGGWPTYKEGRLCRPPWKFKNKKELKDIAPTYASNAYCGRDNLFRCNPTIFGGGSDGKGMCIRIKNYNNLTKVCDEKTKGLRKAHFEKLKTDTSLREQYLKTMDKVKDYCNRNNDQSLCSSLLNNLKEASLIVCLSGIEGTTPENESIGQLADDIEAVVMASSVRPRPRPEGLVSDLDVRIKNYTESDAVKKMIAAVRKNRTLECDQVQCSGRKKENSGRCWRYVKHALIGGGFTNTYPSSLSAKDGGRILKRLGFKNLLEEPKYKNLTGRTAPKGAVLVYEGGLHGHIEVKAGDNEFVSDISNSGPIYETVRGRKLIGVYIK